ILSLYMLRVPATSTLFPYPTLFRSCVRTPLHCATSDAHRRRRRAAIMPPIGRGSRHARLPEIQRPACHPRSPKKTSRKTPTANRSEEHTSELQSRENLVCRLLLEKK